MYGWGIDHEDAIWVSNYSYGDLQHIFWGFENLNFMQSNFFAEIMAQLRHVGPRPEIGSNLGLHLQAEIVEVCQLDFCSYTHILISKLWATFWLVV